MRKLKMRLERYRRSWDVLDSRSLWEKFSEWLDAQAEALVLGMLLLGLAWLVVYSLFQK